MKKERYIGIGVGASRVKIVSVGSNGHRPEVAMVDHYGDPRGCLATMLEEIDPAGVTGIAVTGREGADLFEGRKVYESEAIEEALRRLALKPDLVISMGGESFVLYLMGPDGAVLDCIAGNRCAAGTVEFFKQQLGRMGLTIAEATEIAAGGKIVPLAKRCSVHCKSDCTHALNKKKCAVADIVRTLCHNMAEKAAGLIAKTGIAGGTVAAIGGATANPIVMEYVRELLPDFRVIVPEEAEFFEAFGASSVAKRRSLRVPDAWRDAFVEKSTSFGFLPPLSDYADMVTFREPVHGEIRAGGRYILGVDGGSTTTKAALVDTDTLKICASYYARTNGNPEQAFRECMDALYDQVSSVVDVADIEIVGIGTTGSSGEILSVLCGTPWHHNEIIAHAFGAAHYCPGVDTILEIGGQDSKFTSLRARVPIDFSMNESCSAGTGSFIEETARDDLGVAMEDIADLALASTRPLRFSDQCAAFANTDTRKAFQEGASKEDNLAGLVYSIVENYISKVVGKRRIGGEVLFQGGTSRNRAIACAFAAKTGKRITVPPDPELMGCFGIALWLNEKLTAGAAREENRSLTQLRSVAVTETREFTCRACENMCTVQELTIGGRKYPFGGQCSKWENTRRRRQSDTDGLELVALRNRMLFHDYGVPPHEGSNGSNPSIGMQGVFSVYSLYPLYSWFFHELGYSIKLSERPDPLGVRRCQSARCYPYEIAHGTFLDLVNRGVEHVFSPHVVNMPRDNGDPSSVSCPIAQAAPYYLASAFEESGVKILDPVLDMANGLESMEDAFAALGESLGHGDDAARAAFRKGCRRQKAFRRAVKREGAKALARLKKEGSIGIVLVGRPYNAFSRTANMGVPRKFASAGTMIVPYDFLPYEHEACEDTMYWKYGRAILKSLTFVKRHPQLFAAYISNFGCGPDSFIQHFAGRNMGEKPYLYLELDSHTADAGIGTRVSAFLDVISGYRKSQREREPAAGFVPAELVYRDGDAYVRTSAGEFVPITDERVTVAFPSMGRYNTEATAAACRKIGMNGIALPPADDAVLGLGKELTSGKECTPAILTVGSLVNYWRKEFRRKRKDEILLFFMPTANGPCRFGQYNVYIRMLIKMLKMEDVAVFSLTAENGYGGGGVGFVVSVWIGGVISSLMSDIRSVLKVAAADREDAMAVFEREWRRIIDAIPRGWFATWRALRRASRELAAVKLSRDPGSVPQVLLAGEIFVRCDELSCRGIEDMYAEEGIVLKTADPTEWVYYTDWQYLNALAGEQGYPADFLGARFTRRQVKEALLRRDENCRKFLLGRAKLAFERWTERIIRRILGRSGLVVTRQHDIDHIVRRGAGFMSPALGGEAIVSVGSASEAMEHAPDENYCGVVFIGPFNCMPNGVAESLVKPYARRKGIPYLTFETDAGPIPPNTRSQMEVHMVRARRYGDLMSGGEEQFSRPSSSERSAGE